MKGINKVILIGNTGEDPEYKTLQDGTPVAKLTIATTESYRQKRGDADEEGMTLNYTVAWPGHIGRPIYTKAAWYL